LRAAAKKGWDNPVTEAVPVSAARSIGRFVVVARDGARLRGGPGVEFGIIATLKAGADVNVVSFDGPNGSWARVDLQGDRLVDGYLFAAFLAPANFNERDQDSNEGVDEPSEGEA